MVESELDLEETGRGWVGYLKIRQQSECLLHCNTWVVMFNKKPVNPKRCKLSLLRTSVKMDSWIKTKSLKS